MAGYVITQIEVTDPEPYQEYVAQVLPTVEAFGGKFLVRGGDIEVVEGTWPYARNVVVRFPSLAKAREWYDSDAYKPLGEMRHAASNCNMIFIEGD